MAGRIAFAYHLRWPATVGGAERYYAALAAELARSRDVTYITRKTGDGSFSFTGAGAGEVEVVELGRARPEPRGFARRNLLKAAFAARLFAHLLVHGGRYEVVHVCCFPNVAVLAAALGLAPRRTRLVVDWHEVLSDADWRRRHGRGATPGRALQRHAIRRGRAAVTFSRMHAARLREASAPPVAVVPEFSPAPDPPAELAASGERELLVVFAGRLVEEKRAALVPAVVAELRRSDPAWRGLVFGDGPERLRVETAAAGHAVELRGFAPWEEVAEAFLRASVLLLPTTREGFGLVVLEAAAHGLPAVLVREPDNAAVELLEAGAEGRVCSDADPAALARAVLELAADRSVHARARAWYEREGWSAARTARELLALHARL